MMHEDHKVYQLCLGGIGGQGVMLAAKIMGSALSKDNFNVLQTQSHGIEARGGASCGEVLYGHCEINRLRVTDPDILLALSESALSAYGDRVVDGGYVFYDTYMIHDTYTDPARKVYGAPFTEIALKEMGSDLYANLIAMGYINAITKVLKPESLEAAVAEGIKSNKENNCKALQRGYQEAEKALGK